MSSNNFRTTPNAPSWLSQEIALWKNFYFKNICLFDSSVIKKTSGQFQTHRIGFSKKSLRAKILIAESIFSSNLFSPNRFQTTPNNSYGLFQKLSVCRILYRKTIFLFWFSDRKQIPTNSKRFLMASRKNRGV